MSLALGYDFNKEHIKNTSYLPQSFVNVELEQRMIRNGVINVLQGKIDIPVTIKNPPSDNVKKEQQNEQGT